MKLKDFANMAFWGACGLGLVLAQPTYAEPEIAQATTKPCPENPVFSKDRQNREWTTVTATTKELLPLTFDLHFDYKLSPRAQDFDKYHNFCIKEYLVAEGTRHYRSAILATPYEDLPNKAPAIASTVTQILNTHLRKTLGSIAGLGVEMNSIDVRNVKAPGMTQEEALGLFQGTFNKENAKKKSSSLINATSWDGQPVTYRINFKFDPKNAAYQKWGLGHKAMQYFLATLATPVLQEQSLQRKTGCLKDDHKYIASNIYGALLKNPELKNLFHLFDINIQDVSVSPEKDRKKDSQASRPDYPICISKIETLYKHLLP